MTHPTLNVIFSIKFLVHFWRYQLVPGGFCRTLLFCHDKSLLWAGGLIWTQPTGYSGDHFLRFSRLTSPPQRSCCDCYIACGFGSHISRVKRKSIFQPAVYDRGSGTIPRYPITELRRKILAITFCRALFKTVHLNFVAVTKHSAFNKWGGARCRSWCLFELAGLLVVMIMNWASGAVYTRGRGWGEGSGVRCCVKQADGWLDTVLIMATLVCWEATLCSRSMGAEEWRIVMTRGARVPERDLPLRMLQRANVRSLIGAPLRPSSNFQKFIRVKWNSDNARLKAAVFGFSKLGGCNNVSAVPRLPVNVRSS